MDEKDQIEKIKELLKNDSYDIRESGLELARSLNNPIIYDGLLTVRILIDDGSEYYGPWDKYLEKYFSGHFSDKSEFLRYGGAHYDFNNYILCSLLIEASASSFYIGYKPSLIKQLSISNCGVKNLDFLSNMPNLTELWINDYDVDSLERWKTSHKHIYVNREIEW